MIQRNVLLQLLGGDTALADRMIALFLQQAPQMVAQMHAAQAESRWTDVELLAHDLKNHCRYMGLEQAAALCQSLESQPDHSDFLAQIDHIVRQL